MGVCATAAHPSVHSRPQHLLASRPAFETAIADVVLDRACGFPVRVTPILTLSRPHLTPSPPPPPPPAATPSSFYASGMCTHPNAHLPLASCRICTAFTPIYSALTPRSVAKLLVLHRMIDFASRILSPTGRRRVLLAVRAVLALVLAGNCVGIVSNAVCSVFSVQLVSLWSTLSDAQARGASHSFPPAAAAAHANFHLIPPVFQSIHPPNPCLPKPMPSLAQLILQPAFSYTARCGLRVFLASILGAIVSKTKSALHSPSASLYSYILSGVCSHGHYCRICGLSFHVRHATSFTRNCSSPASHEPAPAAARANHCGMAAKGRKSWCSQSISSHAAPLNSSPPPSSPPLQALLLPKMPALPPPQASGQCL